MSLWARRTVTMGICSSFTSPISISPENGRVSSIHCMGMFSSSALYMTNTLSSPSRCRRPSRGLTVMSRSFISRHRSWPMLGFPPVRLSSSLMRYVSLRLTAMAAAVAVRFSVSTCTCPDASVSDRPAPAPRLWLSMSTSTAASTSLKVSTRTWSVMMAWTPSFLELIISVFRSSSIQFRPT